MGGHPTGGFRAIAYRLPGSYIAPMNDRFFPDLPVSSASFNELALRPERARDVATLVPGTGTAVLPISLLDDIVKALPPQAAAEMAAITGALREEERKRNWQTTVDAMEAARRGETKSFDSTDEMMAWLHADDDADA